ncbi:hypothetical protein [Nocardia terpenica]|uniref:hypothetical protein n=1 Tax=Nocardia terpenica TaxID=455432 RepID=UPI001E489552|nr:hypothetical protein [Nocardia terpenica]
MAREVVRRKRFGWGALVTLALALAVAEEFLICQTTIYPLVPDTYGGRALGINWVWMLWAVICESVGPVLIATQLTELLFPQRRNESWLGRGGLIIAALVFAASVPFAWYGSTYSLQRQNYGHHIQPPLPLLLTGAFIVAALIIGVLVRRSRTVSPSQQRAGRHAPAAWIVGCIATVVATAWESLVLFAYNGFPQAPPVATYLCAVAVASLSVFLILRWSAARNWNDNHRLALVSGALAGDMLLGVRQVREVMHNAPPVLTFHLAVDLLVIAILVIAGIRIRRARNH